MMARLGESLVEGGGECRKKRGRKYMWRGGGENEEEGKVKRGKKVRSGGENDWRG